jgi:hypothetical protein
LVFFKEDEDHPRASTIESGLPVVDSVCLPNVSSLTNAYSHHHSIHQNQIYHPSPTQSSRRNTSSKALSSLALGNPDSHYSPYPTMKTTASNGNDTTNSHSQLPSFHRTPSVRNI